MKKGILLLLLVTAVIVGCKKKKIDDCCNTTVIDETYKNHIIAIPNAFTPNGDGTNDWFVVFIGCTDTSSNCGGVEATGVSLEITNQRGKTIYTDGGQNDLSPHWDGGNEPEGIYEYVATIYFSDGSTKTYCEYICTAAYCNNYDNCRFGNQFDGEGFNANLLSGEVDCV